MTQSVGRAVNSVASTATRLIAEVADTAAPLVADEAEVAAKSFNGPGWLGVAAGGTGIAISLVNTWKETFGSGKSLTTDSLVKPSTVAIGGGMALLTIGERMVGHSDRLRVGMRTAGFASVLIGLVGAITGAVQTFGNPLVSGEDAQTSSQSQSPVRFGTKLPPAPANLAGIEMASADLVSVGRKPEHVSVYVDPATARELPDGTSLGDAIGQARAASQGDDQFRSHAVVQTLDGHYWIARLSGKLDQVDGPKFADGNTYDDRYDPQIGRRQQALQAIAGVEGQYTFPEGMDSTAPVQYTGDIPWVTPTLPKASGSTSTSATPQPTSSSTNASTPSTAATTKAGS